MLLERFISYLQHEKRFSPHTVTSYTRDISDFSAYMLKEYELSDLLEVKHPQVRSWMVELLDQQKDYSTINRKISALRSFYKFLQREELTGHNPLLLIKSPKIPKRLPVIVEDTKLIALLDDPGEFDEGFPGMRDRLVIELLFGTGIRLAEITALRPTDVNFYENTIKVLGKRNKERIIPLTPMLSRLIKLYISEKEKQQFNNNSLTLIVTSKGQNVYPKLIYRIVKEHLSHISTYYKRSPHILRHTFATSLLNDGADINAIKELLGHSSLAATQVYTHNTVDRLKAIYNQAHPKA